MTGDLLLFGVHEAAQEARACTAFDEARRLATWLGAGRPVTPKGVLRPGDVPEAAQVLGAMVPSRFRSAADLPWLHEPWVVALDCGFVVVEGTVAHTGEALAESVGVPDEAVLGFWWRAFRAKIEAWDDPRQPVVGDPDRSRGSVAPTHGRTGPATRRGVRRPGLGSVAALPRCRVHAVLGAGRRSSPR